VSKRLLPLVPADLVVDQVLPTPDHLTVMCRSRIAAPVCPGCGHPSSRRHSSYPRRLADLPWQGRRVQVEVQVRRRRCGRPGRATILNALHTDRYRPAGSFFGDFRTPSASETLYECGLSALETTVARSGR